MATLAQLKKNHPWPFGDQATCLAKIREGNANLETPQSLSFRSGVTIRKSKGWHRITQDSYPLLASKLSDGGTPVVTFREDPVAKTVKEIKSEQEARKPKEAPHPAVAAAQEGLEDDAGGEDADEDEDEEEPAKLATSDPDEGGDGEDSESASKSTRKRRGRRKVTLKKE